MRKLTTREIVFMCIGTVFMVVDVLLFIDFFIVMTIMGITVLCIFAVTLRKKDFLIRFSKIWLPVFVMFVLLNPNPLVWGSQIQRRWMNNRCDLIEVGPYEDEWIAMNSSFQIWFVNSSLNENNPSELSYNDSIWTFEEKVRAIDEFIRGEMIIWTNDMFQYGGTFDHIASLEEVFNSADENGTFHDDCDGISLLTVCFLLYMGFQNSYISEVTYHYHPLVSEVPIVTKEDYLNSITLYKGRVLNNTNDKQSYYIFNQTYIFIPPGRPLIRSIGEIFIGGNIWKYDVTEIFDGTLTGLPAFINYVIIFIMVFLVTWGLIAYAMFGINKRFKTNYPKGYTLQNAFTLGLILYVALIINNIIAEIALIGLMDLTFLCNPIFIGALVTILLIAEKRFVYK